MEYVASPWGQEFANLTHDEALGGGSAGPGKSLVLLMEPVPQIDMEHKRCLLDKSHPLHLDWGQSSGKALHLRRTMPMLGETLSRAKRIFPRIDAGVKWNESKSTFTFSSGYQYQFGHCSDNDAWEQYFSNQFTIIMFDELNQFNREQYDNIKSRCRSTDPVLRKMLKIRSMTNPVLKLTDGIMVEDPYWVRTYFVDPEPRGRKTLITEVKMNDGSKRNWTRIFLPALLHDNPDKEYVEEYERRLQIMKPHMRAALLNGDWYVTAGSFYADYWNPQQHICDPFKVPDDWPRFRSMDWGFKAPGTIHWYAMDPEGTLFVMRELTFQGKTATEVALRVKDIEIDMGVWDDKLRRSALRGPADTQLWERRGESGKSKEEEFRAVGIIWDKADKRSRTRNAERLIERMRGGDSTKPPGIVFFRRCKNAIRTIPGIPTDPADPESPRDGGDDHWHDSILYGCAYASRERLAPKISDVNDDWDDPIADPKKRGGWGYGTS